MDGLVSDYRIIGILVLTVCAMAAGIILASSLIGPRRHGQVKDSIYESGVIPVADARQRFNVRFYLVAVLFLVFDVDILLLYPWAAIYPNLSDASAAAYGGHSFGDLAAAGYNPSFWLVSIGIFFALLAIGFVYEWRRGIFKWD